MIRIALNQNHWRSVIDAVKKDRRKASKISIALSQGQWQFIIDTVKKNRKKAGIWAAKPGDMVPMREKDVLHRIIPEIHGLPIHEAIHIGAPTQVIVSLVSAYPEGVTKKELVMKRLPLHLAAISLGRRNYKLSPLEFANSKPTQKQKKIKEQVIMMLIEYYPPGVLDGDKLWRTPLHYALLNDGSDQIIQSMVRTEPDVAKAQDIEGYTPLHLACQKGYSPAVICTLLHYYPNAVLLVTTEERFTAEHFCRKTKNYASDERRDVLQLLGHYRCVAESNFPTAMEPSSARYIV